MKLVFDIAVNLMGPDVATRIPMTDSSDRFTGNLAGNFLTFAHEICNVFSLEYDMDVISSNFVSSHVYSVEFEGEFACQLNFTFDVIGIQDEWAVHYIQYDNSTYSSFAEAHTLVSIISDELHSVLKTVA